MRRLHTPKFIQKFHVWIQGHHTAAYALAAIGIVIATVAVGAILTYKSPQKVVTTSTPAKKAAPVPPPTYFSPLTGNLVADEAATKQAATAIMIENSPDARPQSGLKSAGVVFEAIAEGGITRFLALYQQEKPQTIGPVRSVRLYYVDWLTPFQPSVAHVGGSKFALDRVRNGQYRDIDQFFNPGTYWRAKDRYAPHNVYTSFGKLDELNNAKEFKTSDVKGFTRKEFAASKAPNASRINVTMSGALYNSSYTYDVNSNTYLRFQAGAPHMDREEGQINPTSIVVLNTEMKRVLEDGYREQITTIGSGKATIFQDGTVVEGTWTKKDSASQLTFTDAAGKDIPLNRGQTWVAAVPNGTGGVTWQ